MANIRGIMLSAIFGAKSFDELGRVIVRTCAEQFSADVCTIWRRYVDDTGAPRLRLLSASAKAPQTLAQEITYAIHEDDPGGRNADGVTGYVAQTRREVHVSSFEQLKREYGHCWKGLMDKTQWEGKPDQSFRSLSAFPLLLGDGLIGVLKLENKHDSPDGFPEIDRHSLRELAPDIALAVHSFSLLESHEERLIQVPAKMVAALLRPFDPKQLVNEIVKTVADSLQAEISSLWLVDPSGKELRLADSWGFSTEARQHTYRLSDPSVSDREIDGITTWVAVRRLPFWANSWEELKAHPSWRGKWDKPMWHNRQQNFRCLYAVPLLRQGAVIGVLKVENRIGAAFFTASDRALCGIMASLIVLVLDLGQELRASLISDLVHLIRSPIGQVTMNLAGLEREIKKPRGSKGFRTDRIEGYIDFIKKSLLSITVTSRTLMAYAQKAKELTPSHHQDKIILKTLLEERVHEIQPLLYSGITTKSNFADDMHDVSVDLDITDVTRVRIAIDNILHNAIKFSRQNGVVEICLNREGDSAIVIIRDHGQGISQDDQARIFEPGFARRAPGHPEGTGMGLTTVKQIFDQLGWECAVSSRSGEETTFRITVPLTKGD